MSVEQSGSTLSVASVLGGPEGAGIQRSISRAARLLRQAEESNPTVSPGTEGMLTVLFRVPGSIWNPEFDGLRVGKLSTAKKEVVIEVAVPHDLADDLAGEFVGQSLLTAIRLATEEFARKKVSADLTRAETLAQLVQAGVAQQPPTVKS